MTNHARLGLRLYLYFWCLAMLGCGFTVRTLASPGAPAASMPDIGDLPPPGGGMARIIVSTDVPARVERIASHRAWTPEASAHVSPEVGEGLLCEETPCVVTLPYGDHELVFKGTRDSERVGSATLKVRSETIVINHTLGRVHHPGGQAVGWGITLVGAVCLGVALGMAETSEKNHTELSSSVAPLAMAGLGTMLFGGVIGLASPTTRQDGASTMWVPKQTAGVAAGFRF